MDDRELRELFCFKIGQELNWFKSGVLNKAAEEIYGMAFQIDTMVNLYELMLEMSQKMDIEVIRRLVIFPRILTWLYERWLKQEDSLMEELERFVMRSLSEIPQTKIA